MTWLSSCAVLGVQAVKCRQRLAYLFPRLRVRLAVRVLDAVLRLHGKADIGTCLRKQGSSHGLQRLQSLLHRHCLGSHRSMFTE